MAGYNYNIFNGVNLNPGTRTIYSSTLTDMRKHLLQDAQANNANPEDYFNGENLPGHLSRVQRNLDIQNQHQDMAKFLQTMGMLVAGRGVNKATYTPAQLNGYNPQNPEYFDMQRKEPIPYQKIITEKNNLGAVLHGYQEATNDNGATPQDTANIIANVKRNQTLIESAFNQDLDTSVYAGVPRSAAQNLYNISLKNQRENSIYALL